MDNSNNIIEYCCYHEPEFIERYNLYSTNNFIPYYSKEDEMNYYLNEFTMHIYIKNHINKIPGNYICVSHYARKFDLENTNIELNKDILVWREGYINKHDYIDSYFEWLSSVCGIDILKMYNNYASIANPKFIYVPGVFNDIKYLYMRETFIMHKDIFVDMITFIENFIIYLLGNLGLCYNTEGTDMFTKHYIYNYHVYNYKNEWLWHNNIFEDCNYHRYLAFIIEFLICHYCTIQYGNNVKILYQTKNG